jgi:hypothetical protein
MQEMRQRDMNIIAIHGEDMDEEIKSAKPFGKLMET